MLSFTQENTLPERKWWGYRNAKGGLIVSRFESMDVLLDARRSPAIAEVRGPFMARGGTDAMRKLEDMLGGRREYVVALDSGQERVLWARSPDEALDMASERGWRAVNVVLSE